MNSFNLYLLSPTFIILLVFKVMANQQSLKSRLYRLESHNQEDIWVEKCQGYPHFKKQDNIFKLKYYSMPNRQLFYEIVVNSNIRFDKNQNGVEWVQIREGEIMAISFKEEYSANAFWNMIDEYQRKYQVSVPAASGTHFYFQYRVPDPKVENLADFYQQIEKIPQNQRHERLTSILLTKRQFLPKLGVVFAKLQEAKNLQLLQLMFKIVKIIFNASNQQLLYELMCNENFIFVLGALQYDPNFKSKRPKHREFIKNSSRMMSVVQFKNTELLNLSIITYRLEYVRECILLPYLNDYSFAFTSIMIKNNYKKILIQVFNPRKKQFINDLFDLLRKQSVLAFKLLRQIFRIGKNVYAEDLYLQIAERDFFDLMMKNMKQLRDIQKGIVQQSQTQSKFKKKKKPEEIKEIVEISIEILEQFMEYEPLHFKNYCSSQGQTVSKYPTVQFLLEQFEFQTPTMGEKIENILKILVTDKDNHPIKKITHQRILKKFLENSSHENIKMWIQIFNKIITPLSVTVCDATKEIINGLVKFLSFGSKNHQINVLKTLKTVVHTYVQTDEDVERLLLPLVSQFLNFLKKARGMEGIRVSIFLSILKPKKYSCIVEAMLKELSESNHKLYEKYYQLLNNFLVREEISLSSDLKRERSEQLRDDECFEKIEKKIKID